MNMDDIRYHYKRNVMLELCMLIHPDKKRKVCKDPWNTWTQQSNTISMSYKEKGRQ